MAKKKKVEEKVEVVEVKIEKKVEAPKVNSIGEKIIEERLNG